MPNIAEVCERLDKTTDRLSTQVRTLSLGLLAFTGGLLVSGVTGPSNYGSKLPSWLLHRLFIIGVIVLLSIALDLAQYCASYLHLRPLQQALDQEIKAARKKNPLIDPKSVEKDYTDDHPGFKAAIFLFWAKIVVLFIAVGLLTLYASVLLKQGGA
jgi:hypothetical protein